ncbi:TetR/AcrR family transcriptional regulator [Thalassotalea crassostreae]|uniref:TetR/AcrR family transcriptional regulator n=1 Tax=Thalassotalea crassostreae TaxID=1763536 RepID=UPI0008394346|nr:TetR family transcriptional regulator [Thalassotalea crassostreae]
MSTQKVNRRAKGEQTRLKILQAAIEVIATQGVKATTHRAVAQKADTQLSLTTYYFKDIKELVREAILLSSDQMLYTSSEEWRQAFELLDSYDATSLRKVSVREQLCEQLSNLAAHHMYENILQRPIGLAVEQIFFTEMVYSAELKDLANKHIDIMLNQFIMFARYFNKVDPEVDAELTMIALTRTQYKYLSMDNTDINLSDILVLVKRQLSWVMGLKRQ